MSKLAIEGGEKTVLLTDPIWPQVGDEEIQAVSDALRKSKTDINYITSVRGGGPTVEFEKKLAQYFSVKYALTTNSGCAALHTALMAIGIGAGDEVIVASYTWGQTVSPILQQCAIPVFADIDPLTYTLDPISIRQHITPETKAIMVVHLYGQSADMDPILEISREFNLWVIEDCAQAAGAHYKGKRVGTLGHIGCFSIGDGKQMVGGEGGFLLFQDNELYDRALLNSQFYKCLKNKLTNQKLINNSDTLLHTYHIHPLAAVMCSVQLDYLDVWNAERRENHQKLSMGLQGVPGIRPVIVGNDRDHIYHHYSPSFMPTEVEGISRELYVAALSAEGVYIDYGYVPQPIYLWKRIKEHTYFGKGLPWSASNKKIEYNVGDCPNAEARCNYHELDIGEGPAWRGDQSPLVNQIIDAFQKVGENIDRLRLLSKKFMPNS